MIPKASFRSLVEADDILVLPAAHDALSARLIESAGFDAYFVGGFQIAGVHFGVPDVGLIGLGDIAPIARNIISASNLPVMVDIDDGYGDLKNVVRTLNTYEDMGAGCVFMEDQVSPKRCGHMAGKRIISTKDMQDKIRVAASERRNPDTFIVARTDAIATDGLDEALRRGEAYLEAGADGLFIEAPTTMDDLLAIPQKLDAPLLANMLEGGITPLLKPHDLQDAGYAMSLYGLQLLMPMARMMEDMLRDLKAGNLDRVGQGYTFEEFKSAVGFDAWTRIEKYAEQN